MLQGGLCVLMLFVQTLVWARVDIQYSQSHLTQYIRVEAATEAAPTAGSDSESERPKIDEYHTLEKDWEYQVGYMSGFGDSRRRICVKFIGDIQQQIFLENNQTEHDVSPDCYLKHLFGAGKCMNELSLSGQTKSFFEEQLQIMVVCLKNGNDLKIRFSSNGEIQHETFSDFISWLNTVDPDESVSVHKEIVIRSFGEKVSDRFHPITNHEVTGLLLLSLQPDESTGSPEPTAENASCGTGCLKVISGNRPQLLKYTPTQTSRAMRYISASLHASGYLGNGYDSTLNYDVFRGNITDASTYATEPQTWTQYAVAQTKSWLYLPHVKECLDHALKMDMFGKTAEDTGHHSSWLRIPSCKAALPYIKTKAEYILSHELFSKEDPEIKFHAKNDTGWCDSPLSKIALRVVQPGSPKSSVDDCFFRDIEDSEKFDFTHVSDFDFKDVSQNIVADLHKTNQKHAGFRCSYTGLRFVVLEDSYHPNELIVAFSCLFASNREWHFGSIKNVAFNGVQLASLVLQLGPRISVFYPLIYEQALRVVETIKEQMGQIEGKDYQRITLAGYCFGGSIAQYVGGMQGIETFCVNPFPLGLGLQRDLETKIADMSRHVTNLSIEHDWVSNLMGMDTFVTLYDSKLGFNRARLFGKRFMIPASKNGYNFSQRHLRVRTSSLRHAQWCVPKEVRDTRN